jgi:hypothetical protein
LIGFLILKGFSHERTEREGQRVFLCFKQSPGLVQSVTSFYSDGEVAANAYWRALKQAKDLVNGNGNMDSYDKRNHSQRRER